MGVLERQGERLRRAGNGDQMHVIGHEAIAEQREVVKFAVLPQQLQINQPVGVTAEDCLPGIATLRNMMRNVGDDDTRETSHADKVSDAGSAFRRWRAISRSEFPHWNKKIGATSVCPAFVRICHDR